MPSSGQFEARAQLQQGAALHRSGKLGLAQSHYQRAAKLDPQNAEAWHLLGLVAMQLGQHGLALRHLRTSVKLRPDFAEAQNNLGIALSRNGRGVEAIAAFAAALRARKGYVEAMFNLGVAYEAAQAPEDAERAYRQTLAWRSNHVDALINLGNLLRRRGRPAEALVALETAERMAPERAQASGNLAMLLNDLGRYADALRFARAAIALEEKSALWWTTLGSAQRQLHAIDGAITSLGRALELDPANAKAALELALALEEAGDDDGARALWRSTRPPEGNAGRIRWLHALSLPAIYQDDAHLAQCRERFAQGLCDLETALAATPVAENALAASTVAPFYLHYQPRDNTDLQFRFGDLVARVMERAAPALVDELPPRRRDGRVRVGFVSSHLMQHTVSRYFSSLISGLDPARFDVRVWYTGGARDASTQSIAGHVSEFVQTNADVVGLAEEIRQSGVDVLVYPEIGMDPKHQALAAFRLAPVQCVLYGHPVTSGAPRIDHFLSGAAFEPDDAERHYREKLVRLPGLGTRPQRPPLPGASDWLAAHVAKRPLVPCLQNVIKLAPFFDDALAEIAAETGCCVAFFARNPPLMRRFRARIEVRFRARGLDPDEHLAFLPAQSYADYLAGIASVPLVLDSPWFSGGSTSLDAFSVGTPVLAWEGPMARGRQTAAMLRMLDARELIAVDANDYVAKAAALLREPGRLRDLRGQVTARADVLFEDAAPLRAFAEFLEKAAG